MHPTSPRLRGVRKSKLQAKNQKFVLHSLIAIEQRAKKIARSLCGGEVLALTGPLGSGKTTFVQYLAEALGIKENVRSPSFVVLQIFPIKAKVKSKSKKLQRATLTLCHVDAYHLRNAHELEAIGLHDYLGRSDVITVIEWAERIKETLPGKTVWFKFQYAKQGRRMTRDPLPTLSSP